METITRKEFDALCQQKQIKLLKTNYDRPKLYESSDGLTMTKIFHPKNKWFSSNKHKPYALRFCANSDRLRAMAILAPTVSKLQYCPELKTYLLSYQKLPGKDIRNMPHADKVKLIKNVAFFISELHQKGIFFRSLHLENVLQQKDHRFALIDVADVRFSDKPLSLYLRYRNLKHFFLSKEDRPFWKSYGTYPFLVDYFKQSGLSKMAMTLLSTLIRRFCGRRLDLATDQS